MYAPSGRNTRTWDGGTTSRLEPVCGMSSTSLPVWLRAAHHPNRGGGVCKWEMGDLRPRQITLGGQQIHRFQQLPEPIRGG